MGKQFDSIGDDHRAFIEAQPLFFTGSAAAEGKINVSPKGRDSLRILSPGRVIWRNLTGSGNESATHVAAVPRMTLMWCSFGTRPLILRVYGSARAVHRGDADWPELDAQFEPDFAARQIFAVTVEMVQTSCGYAVPFMDYVEDRRVLSKWAENRGEDGISEYWQKRNQVSLDGKPTGILGS